MVTLPRELIEAPELALYHHQISARLEEENLRRRKFRDELSPNTKAEFINGEVFVHSPATVKHTLVRQMTARLFSVFVEQRHLGVVLDEKALICLTRNDYEPDISFFGSDKAARLLPDQLELPAPDFIAEVLSPSTERHDRGVKFRDYAAHGVAEYWLIDPATEVIEQYALAGERYELIFQIGHRHADKPGDPRLEIPVRAMFDAEENLRLLRHWLTSGI